MRLREEEQDLERILGFVDGKLDLLLDELGVLEIEDAPDLDEEVLAVLDIGR